jgi:6-pyruvoyltetrahydropterin/6-carboxytetrahydropterin synthase
MITDFKHANWLKVFLDEVMDHKFLVDMDDPFLKTFLLERLDFKGPLFSHTDGNYKIINPSAYKDNPTFEHEIYEGLVIVPFVPTAENFSKWLFNIVDEKMSAIGVTTSKVEFYETPKCKSVYVKG